MIISVTLPLLQIVELTACLAVELQLVAAFDCTDEEEPIPVTTNRLQAHFVNDLGTVYNRMVRLCIVCQKQMILKSVY